MAARRKATTAQRGGSGSGRPVELMSLDKLLLDQENARLGAESEGKLGQAALLDRLVDDFGVDDLLSSIAVNGYFDAEPLVGVPGARGKVRIVEGNRRLAACLILAGDPRASRQVRRTHEFRELQKQHGQKPVTRVPVMVHPSRGELLPYLGVRHIGAPQAWDSYAKAAWIARVIRDSGLTLEQVSEMTGDQHRTVARTLEGFYFINQLIKEGRFNPRDSKRPGRGSNPEYPFSWIYTALGFSPVRRWLDLPDLMDGPSHSPIPRDRLPDAGDLVVFMFGSESQVQPASIQDSRQISRLARLVGVPAARRQLKRGRSVEDVEELARPTHDRVESGLLDAYDALSSVLPALAEGEIKRANAETLVEPSRKVNSLAAEVHKKVRDIAGGEEG